MTTGPKPQTYTGPQEVGDLAVYDGEGFNRLPVGDDDGGDGQGETLEANSAATNGQGVRWKAATPLTAKGDLMVMSGIPARLPRGGKGAVLVCNPSEITFELEWLAAGTDGHVLTLDSTQDRGVKWAAAGAASEAFPIGAVFIAVVSTNPATLLGYGTWAAFGTGRMLIGLDAGDTDFDVVEETGGAKTHTLAEGNLPSHTHGITDPGHTHVENGPTAADGGSIGIASDTNASGSADSGLVTGNSTTGITATDSVGSGTAVNHMPPFIAVYMWKRTA